MNYKDTLNLPATAFPMKAGLAQTEPPRVQKWKDGRLYHRIIEEGKDRPRFVMHDGPPYANGYIHSGTVLNKILKDFVVKYRNARGFQTEFVPGWDCHGLPIENNVEKELGGKGLLSVEDFRGRCRDFALRFVGLQRDEFRRLGVLADWDEPYLTLRHSYEATIAREFGAVVRSGSVYRGKKPVYWCSEHKTALAEAEIEYGDHSAPSVWVRFPMGQDARAKLPFLPAGLKASFVIWTTTPWTLPANLAITLHPQFDYVLVQSGDEAFFVAEELAQRFAKEVCLPELAVLGRVKGLALERTHASHPFLDRESLLILGDFVTLEAGTGCVHTAPGHGADDYNAGQNYGLAPYAPVDENGRFTEEVPLFQGRFVFDCDKDIVQLLADRGMLVGQARVQHSYPCCLRCRKPIIFRATDQWFISMEQTGIRQAALEAIDRVKWVPERGRERIRAMVEGRPDWCISRQRLWGVPIVAFFCEGCGEVIADPTLIDGVADIFEKEGADSWYLRAAKDLLPPGFKCPKCGGDHFRKENDIIDVWFESGVSYAAVIERRYGAGTACDLYLEGSDQHRGWFHSTLLESVATRGKAPYKTVLTHGFVVDGQGRKISKTLGNFVPPAEIINQYGAEIYRLWVAAENYQDDIRISPEILGTLTDAYRKVRNTFRFLLGNLDGFVPDRDLLPVDQLLPMDRWMLHNLNQILGQVDKAYEEFDFHRIFQGLVNFTAVDLSSLYLDVLKDRLYVDGKDSLPRRSARTALWWILHELVVASAPILSFTCDEVWDYSPRRASDPDSVFLAAFPLPRPEWDAPELGAEFEVLRTLRNAVQKEAEAARVAKTIGHALDAKVTLTLPEGSPSAALARKYAAILEEWFITSAVEVRSGGDAVTVQVEKAPGAKCERCWHWSTTLGHNPEHPGICKRCAAVLGGDR